MILGAHLDSWDLGRGALDNGCNVALVIDVARQMAALARAGVRPRRTVRFVLYTGEEAGQLGSWGEVQNGRAQLDRVRAQVIYDEGTGRTTGFSLGGRDDLRELKANEAIAGVLVWGLAESDTLPARQTRGEVEALVATTGLAGQMKAFGLWEDFAAGRRGRARARE